MSELIYLNEIKGDIPTPIMIDENDVEEIYSSEDEDDV